MKIAIYSRKSKFTGKGDSIENQIEKCKQYISFKFGVNPEEAEIFVDEGFSGKNEDRPAYQNMIRKVKNKDIGKIIIYQLNRLGRNARDIHNTMQMCDDIGCIIYSATEGFDSSTSFGRAVIGILASLAQLEREQLAERVKDNMYTLAKMGRWLGGQSPLGFKGTREYYIDENGKERSITQLKQDTSELKKIKLLYRKYIEEKSLSKVGKWSLTNNLKGKNGGNLDKTSINTILQNPVYVKSDEDVINYLSNEGYEVCGTPNGNGLLRYGKDEKIVAVAKHKGIIDSKDWLEVQRILKENTVKAPRLGKTNTALLTGILKCKCGSGMRVTYGHINKNGVKPFYYTCSMKNNSGGTRCNSKNINGILIEKKLITHLKNYNEKNIINNLNGLIEKSNKIDFKSSQNNLNLAIEKSEKAIKKLFDKLKLIDDEDVSKMLLNEIKNEKENIKKLQIEKEKLLNDEAEISIDQKSISEIVNELIKFKTTFDNLSFEDKKKTLKKMISSISINDNDEFEIEFNIKKKLDNAFNTLSSIFSKYKLSHFRQLRFCMSYK